MSDLEGTIYYEYAHRNCHPETCSCRDDYRVVEHPYTIDWAGTEQEAKILVEFYRKAKGGAV